MPLKLKSFYLDQLGTHTLKTLNSRLCGQKLHLKKKVNYLGIIIDEHLAWEPLIQDLTTKLSRTVGFLSKLRHLVDFKTLISIYYALFESHVSYCLQTIGFITQAFFEKIEVLQNKALRTIHFKPPRESARPLYVKAAILPIRKLLKVKNCLLAHEFVKRIIPSYFLLDFLRRTPNQEGNNWVLFS